MGSRHRCHPPPVARVSGSVRVTRWTRPSRGVTLAGLAEDAHASLGQIDDDCLTGIIRAWRRISSWAAARELAAAAELARRRPTDGLPGSGRECVADELAAALTLTVRAAQEERDLAWQLANLLPATLTALSEGRIDLPKARVIATGTAELDPGHAAAVEAAVLPKAPGQTTGQLRAAVARAVLAADPDAARRQRAAAQARAHVSCWSGPAGTGHLEGHDLPAAQTLAADARLTQIATAWKKQGAQGGLDLLRAHAYLALLLGHDTTTPPQRLLLPSHPVPQRGSNPGGASRAGTRPSTSTNPQTSTNPRTSPDSQASTGPDTSLRGDGVSKTDDPLVPAGLRSPDPQPPPGAGTWPTVPPAAAQLNLTIPLATWLGRGDAPGEVPGFGPVDPDTARTLATTAAGHPATRWTVTLTSPDGHALGHGTSRPGTGPPGAPGTTGPPGSRPSGTSPPGTSPPGSRPPGSGWTVTIEPIATGTCDHQHEEPGYRPSPTLARLLRARTTTCSFPGCRRPAIQCDLDHTIPYEDGGRTCECNVASLCRRHHRVKQAEGWRLEQPSPGVLVWLTPAGRRYTTLPSQHPT